MIYVTQVCSQLASVLYIYIYDVLLFHLCRIKIPLVQSCSQIKYVDSEKGGSFRHCALILNCVRTGGNIWRAYNPFILR